MFLTETDYDTLILDDDRLLISQATDTIRQQAETMAIDQMSGYLRPKYDTAATFAKTAADRSQALLMYCMDITLYHLHASIPGRFVPEIRRIRYEDALAWLKDVAKGLIDPDLVLKTDPTTGESVTGPAILFGGNDKQDNSW
jgi:phage gp36-like protein